jgi:hypothetical protein
VVTPLVGLTVGVAEVPETDHVYVPVTDDVRLAT